VGNGLKILEAYNGGRVAWVPRPKLGGGGRIATRMATFLFYFAPYLRSCERGAGIISCFTMVGVPRGCLLFGEMVATRRAHTSSHVRGALA
jgi:hypothetical protein